MLLCLNMSPNGELRVVNTSFSDDEGKAYYLELGIRLTADITPGIIASVIYDVNFKDSASKSKDEMLHFLII